MKPNHLAFVCKGSVLWASKKKKNSHEGYKKSFKKIFDLIDFQIKKNIPITTHYLLPQEYDVDEDEDSLMDETNNFLNEALESELFHKNKIKVSIIGKWYSLPPKIIETIRRIIDETKDYDGFFVNFCINYDGQEEIVDACKMIARRVKLGKIDADAITKETIKDDLYSSYFLPPDFVFVTGKKRSLSGFLLWDTVDSEIIFTNKEFPDLDLKLVDKVIKRSKKYN